MITDKKSLKEYLEKDKYALGISRKFPRPFGDEIWKYQIYLRKHEYYQNTKKNKLLLMYYKVKHHNLGIKLGFSIPCNVFGAGLRINHYGYIVVNPEVKIGEFCDIHQGVNIGVGIDGKVPTLGNDIWIGPGAKIYGDVKIGNSVMIGANSVVNKSFSECGARIAGIPANIISKEKNVYKRTEEYKRMRCV